MKYLLDIPAEVRAKIKYVASLQGITMNALMLKAIQMYLEKVVIKNGASKQS